MSRQLLCCFLLLAAWPVVPAFAAPGLPVTVVNPFRSHWKVTTEYLAKVSSFGRLPVTAPTSGWLRGPRLKQGARVKVGMILGTIKPLGFDAQLRAAKSALRLASIQLRQAHHLYKKHDNAVIVLDEAQNNYHEAKSRVQALKMKQAASRLRVPADGTLYYRLPSGAFVNDANVTPIVAYVDVSHPLWISVNVPPSQVRELKPGKKVALRRGDWSREGKVSSIGDSALLSGLVQVIVQPPITSPLRAGEWIHVALPGKPGKGWRLPRAALIMQGNHSFVYVLRHGRAREASVHLQYAAGSWVWVSGALDAASQVIVKGADRVSNGIRVHLMQATNSSRA
ncbi:MAG: efflux RND transporter periplasmic adaptor subunit [Gammaproteobacteria bacterium]